MAPSFVRAAIPWLLAGSLWATADASALSRRQEQVAPLPEKWKYQGCYKDANPRTLTGPNYANYTGMTGPQCIAFCDARGYIYAGTEYSSECFCGNGGITTQTVAPQTDCSMSCAGNATESCGGPDRLSVYWNGENPPAGPSHNPGTNGYGLLGCYTEGTTGRALTNQQFGWTGQLTVAKCVAQCKANNYALAGVEYAQECYCDNELRNTAQPAPEGLAGCNMPCLGNTTEYCGAGNRLDVYQFGYVGASSTTTTTRTSTTTQTTTPVATTTTAANTSASTSASSSPATTTTTASSSSTTTTRTTSSTSVSTSASSSPVTSTTSASPSSSTTTTTSASPSATQVLSRKPTIGAFSRLGCYSDAVGNRVMNGQGGAHADFNNQSLDLCATTCSRLNYPYFGVEYGGECWCADTVAPSSQKTPDADCSFICPGNQYQYCGAGDRLELYLLSSLVSSTTTTQASTVSSTTTSSSTSPSTTTTTQAPTTTTTSQTTTTTVSSSTTTQSSTTVSSSTTLSSSSSSTTSSTSSSVSSSSSLSSSTTSSSSASTSTSASSTTTSSSTTSDSTTSSSSLVTSSSSTSSSSSTTSASTTSSSSFVTSSSTTSSPSSTTSASSTSISSSTSSISSSTSASSTTSQTSSTTSSSSSSTTSAPSTTSSQTTTSTTSTTTTSAGPSISGVPAGWSYVGCYTEGKTGRALGQQQPGGADNSIQTCINRCASLGYKIAGLEYSEQCFCDNNLYGGASPLPETRCNMPCRGNTTQMCGAGDVLSLYSIGPITIYQPPVPQNTSLPGSWEYSGCYTDQNVNGRVLPWQIISRNNSATSCLTQCSTFGYMSGGMQYGEECYCGDHDAMIAAGSTKRPDSECNQPCTGDPRYLCGGGNRNTYYRWTGTPLYSWKNATGIEAGSYEFFIPGVVIPLITTLGINDKVVFMEKSGTGAPNTTGTYELDLTMQNDYVKAFRPLSVKTDIFCAAGVTLPDKAGRQLNIGGWSGRSTFGVRLYTPSGSDGVAGTTNWQEDETKVSLLDGRWYPSAINLANGSVLVIGGETGSNADPTPTLEILPPPVGGYSKYEDWLERTDPNNLYPFLWVLPSGGIFVMYYNEARILDERTFDTVKTLPNMPGNVNDPNAGRTYPLEGTGVMLPLYPPYTAPATFMACGGSTEGPGFASDNCVSTQPEVANPTWVVERMPSKRVMSCMAALPDGTYLIANGAKQGQAGFGLATNPNLQAVLYDPSQPVGARMTIMASTIVARLYHSEAILMPDGRVLISGSDPEDGKNPQEYRVEVFNPPYTLSGQAPPTFDILDKDWAYGETIGVSASFPSGNLGGVRASMMSTVSSTHGNSMGQRTLFLAINCSGSAAAATCNIVAPPSSHVAPPGWYQIFLLDGKMPGRGKWIRIGGEIADAAGIGNWPQAPGFTVPGLGPLE